MQMRIAMTAAHVPDTNEDLANASVMQERLERSAVRAVEG
jgi:hypothetical protein